MESESEALSPKFPLGQVTVTTNALQRIGFAVSKRALARHAAGDWGEINEHDHAANETALQKGGRLLSVYWATDDVKFYIITEADRCSTTLLLAEDY